MTTPTPSTSSASPPRSWRRYLPRTRRAWLRAILIAAVVVLLLSFILAKRTPGWYQPADAANAQIIDAGDRFQFTGPARMHNAIHRTALGVQTVEYTQDEINAFLAIAFSNASGSAPRQISQPMVLFNPNSVTIAARASNLPLLGSGVLSLTGHVDISPPSSSGSTASVCLITLDSIHLGSLPVPQALVRERISQAILSLATSLERLPSPDPASPRRPTLDRSELNAILQHISRGEPFDIPTRLENRTAYLHAITVTPNKLTITFAPTPLKP